MCGLRIWFVVLLIILEVSANRPELCPEDNTKTCLLREYEFNQQIWKYWSGFYCYFYTNDARLYFKYPSVSYPIQCRGENTTMPVTKINDTTLSLFDYTDEQSMFLLKQSFRTDNAFDNYLKCCREAIECCENKMDKFNIKNNRTHCPAIWDGWSCFPPTKAATTAMLSCSSQAYQSPDDVCTLNSEKYCLWNKTLELAIWNQTTNYKVCSIAPVYESRHKYHVIILAICTVFCFPAILIFFIFEKLRKTIRVALHRNLLIAICVRNCLTIMSKELVILDALKIPSVSNHVLENNGVECRVLSFFENSAKNCIYGSMIIDGFYLHKVIVRAFAKEIDIKIFYMILAAFAFIPSLIWAISMGAVNADSCWMVDTNQLQWIVDSFRLAVLAINIFLLLDIVRVMLFKVKRGSPTQQTMAAFRATIFLFPLFGIHIIITAHKMVYDNSCTAEDIYDYARYTMEALQGIFVACLFCYTNSEVHNEISNGYRKFTIFMEQRFGCRLRREPMNQRRTTTATYVPPEGLNY